MQIQLKLTKIYKYKQLIILVYKTVIFIKFCLYPENCFANVKNAKRHKRNSPKGFAMSSLKQANLEQKQLS